MDGFLQCLHNFVSVDEWIATKWIHLVFAAFVLFAAFRLSGMRQPHRWVMVLSYASLLTLFVYGIIHRGIMGRVPDHPRDWGFYVFFIPHIVGGALYLLVGLYQIGGMTYIVRNTSGPSSAQAAEHRGIGWFLTWAVTANAVFGLAM